MSDFAVFFPSGNCSQLPSPFSKLESVFRDPLRADKIHADVVHGAPVLLSSSFSNSPQFYAREDGSGWIVIKGTIFDLRSENPKVDLERLLNQILDERPGDLNRYEGTFAAAAWDAQETVGWVFNDQASVLNLYYVQYDGGLYVTTSAMALARSLGLEPDPHGVLEFLMKATLSAPSTMFRGMWRVDIGEHVHYRAGKLTRRNHWHACGPKIPYRSVREAAESVSEVIVDRLRRYVGVAGPVIGDLSGGLDTRVLASAADAAGLEYAVTVNGPPDAPDVRIAHRLAETLGLEIRYFDNTSLWKEKVVPDMRRELVYRASGELPFVRIYHHVLTRPALGEHFKLHMIGTGGDFLRTFPWEEGFKLRHKLFAETKAPGFLFSFDAFGPFHSWFRSRIRSLERKQPGASATQRLDETFLWKMTSHSSLYLSALHNWLPTTAPMLSAGIIKAAITVPWTMRLGSGLQRHVIYRLSPRAAGIESWLSASRIYRGTAEPGIKNTVVEMRRYLYRFVRGVDRKLLGGVYFSKKPLKAIAEQSDVPFFTEEFRRFLLPETMRSRALYDTEGLRTVLGGDDSVWKKSAPLISRLATIEQVFRELDFESQPDFWAPVTAGSKE